MTSATVIKCFNQLFSLFGMPSFVHNDRAPDFLSAEVKDYLHSKGIATSKTSRYNPKGNGQVERYNGVIWKTVRLALISRRMNVSGWETVLPDALHSIRSLLCTAINETPHERLFSYNRKSSTGSSIPSWLTPGPVYIRNHTRTSKHDPLVVQAELLEANPQYAFVRLDSGHETTVSLRDVAPCSRNESSVVPNNSERQELSLGLPATENTVSETETPITTSQHDTLVSDSGKEDSSCHDPHTPIDGALDSDSQRRYPVRERRNRQLFADSSHSSL